MKYKDKISKTVYQEVEIEIPDGVTYFHTWDEDDEPEYYYKLNSKTFHQVESSLVCKTSN